MLSHVEKLDLRFLHNKNKWLSHTFDYGVCYFTQEVLSLNKKEMKSY